MVATLPECKDCFPSQNGVTLRCWSCATVSHFHMPRWEHVDPDQMVVLPCPNCQASNGVKKPRPRLLLGVQVHHMALQPELLR